jgi:hypothetical protein
MNGNHTERLSQEGECRNEEEYGILERASAFSHRVLEEIEALTGTTACKSVQLVRLKKWALEQGCWYDDCSQFGDYFDRSKLEKAEIIYDIPSQKWNERQLFVKKSGIKGKMFRIFCLSLRTI